MLAGLCHCVSGWTTSKYGMDFLAATALVATEISSSSSPRVRPIEALDEPVLRRLSRRDEAPIEYCLLAPGKHGIAGELDTMTRRRSRVRPDYRRYEGRVSLCGIRARDGLMLDPCRPGKPAT